MGLPSSLCRAAEQQSRAFYWVNGGRNRSEPRGKVRFWSQKSWLEIDWECFTCRLSCNDFILLVHIVTVNDEWLVRGLAIYFFILPPPHPFFWLWLAVFMIRRIDNLIWLNSAGSDYKDTSCILSGSFNCHDGICVIGDWSLRRIKTQRWCMRREMISGSESG